MCIHIAKKVINFGFVSARTAYSLSIALKKQSWQHQVENAAGLPAHLLALHIQTASFAVAKTRDISYAWIVHEQGISSLGVCH